MTTKKKNNKKSHELKIYKFFTKLPGPHVLLVCG